MPNSFGSRFFAARFFAARFWLRPGSVVPPVPVPSFVPAAGSGGGSTMRLARPAGRFGEDHAVYPGPNVEPEPRTEVFEAPEDIEPAEATELAERAALVTQKALIKAAEAALSKRELAAIAKAERLAARETQRLAALAAAEQRQIEEDELMMLAIAIGMTL